MKLLLDTHVLLWWLGEWWKESLGKLRSPDFDEQLAAESFESLPLSAPQTAKSRICLGITGIRLIAC